jgi:alpha-galactosidase
LAWNSWDYYFSIFNEDDLDENLDALAALRDQGVADVQHVVIDMGWFVDFGEWIHNGRFPRGMQATAARIKSRGFTPGIWVAPFIVHFMSTTFLRHPEALATDAKGQVMIDQWGLAPNGWLDPTKPDGRDLLHGWFKRLRDAGFEYFKTDFVHYLITKVESRCFHQNDLGRMEIVRQGMQIIRDAIGDDAFLLACGCPPEAVLGIADACRIGGDISTYFSTTRLAAPMLAGRYWMNNRFWANDPDFLIVRGDATADDVHHNPFHAANLAEPGGSRSGPPWANEQEPRIWATLVGMSGGMLTLADHAGRLNRIGRGMVRTVMAHADDEAARPLDLMERLLPRYWLRTGRHPALAVVNWDDEASSFDLPAGRWPALERFAGAASLWGNGEIRAENGTLTVRVSGRDAVWFKLQG